MIGRTLGQYELEGLLGAGAMGDVYRARDTRLGRSVALKILPPRMAANEERRLRFEREAQAVAAVDHPNIVTIHSVEEVDGFHFITMQLVEGQTLTQLIPDSGFPLEQFFDLAIPLADAIAAAHQQGIIHRDLKPANIMVSEDGRVRVLDFGLAKLKQETSGGSPLGILSAQKTEDSSDALTEDGKILGTVDYMSPEQAEGEPVGFQSDLFSLGIILYELATGELPFKGSTKISVLSAILRETPASVTDLKPGLPRQLARIIKHALEKDLKRRYQSALDLRNDLAELRSEVQTGEYWTSDSSRPPPRRRAKRRTALLVGTAVVAAVALLVGLYLNRSDPPSPGSQPVPITSQVGSERTPAISPDGNHVAFVWNGESEGVFDLYVKVIGSGTPLRLTSGTRDALDPTWSPDGGEIAFLRRNEDDGYDVLVVPALGGPERSVGSVANVGFHGLDWSAQGDFLAVVDRAAPEESESLYLLSTDTGEKSKLTSPPLGGMGDRNPAFSPDGKTVAFVRWYEARKTDLYLVSVDGRRLSHVITQESFIRGLDWLPDGSGLVFSSQGSPGLLRVSLDGELSQLPYGENARGVSVSRTRSRLLYSQWFADANIWRVGGPGATNREPPTQLIASSRDDWSPAYSPDGTRIAFGSDRSGLPQIWICDSEGGNCSQLATDELAISPRWSPDSRTITFGKQVGNYPGVWVVEVAGGFPRRLLEEEAMNAAWDWSLDGEWLYLFSDRGGDYQIWRMDTSGGRLEQMTQNGGLLPKLGDDGFLYYLKLTSPYSIWRMPGEGGEEELVLQTAGLGHSGFDLWRRSLILLVQNDDAGPSIESLDLDSGKLTRVAELGKRTRLGKYGRISVSPDGRWVAYTQEDGRGSDIIMVEGFR